MGTAAGLVGGWRPLARLALALLSVVALGLGEHAARAAAQPSLAVPADLAAQNLAVITIREEITPVTRQSVSRRIRHAVNAGADLLVFDIDTPGGELYSALGIASDIKQAGVRTVAWINTRAYSGGALIALACGRIVINDPASMGDIKPVTAGLEGVKPLSRGQLEKVLPPILSEVLDSAQRNNRALGRYVYDEQLVQAMVVSDAQLWLVRNKETGQQLCVTRAEFEMLFPGERTDQTPRIPSLGGQREAPTQPARGRGIRPEDRPPAPIAGPIRDVQPDGSPAEGWKPVVPASPTVSSVGAAIGSGLTQPSIRPGITAADVGRYELIQRVSDGTGPIVLNAEDMRFFGLAANTAADGSLRPIRNDADLKAFFGARNLIRLDPNWSEGLVFFLTNPIVRGVLIVTFLLAMFLEMANPGLVLPGGVAALALITLLAPPMLIGMATWWEVAAIAAGILLIALEIFVIPGFGVPGILGLVLLFGGLVGTFVPPKDQMFPGQDTTGRDLSMGVVTVLLAAVTAGIGIYFITRHFGSLPILNRLILKEPGVLEARDDEPMLEAMGPAGFRPQAGMEGVALTPLRPAGKIRIGEEDFDVVSELGFVDAGTRVRVLQVTPFRIAVEPINEPNPAQPPPLQTRDGGESVDPGDTERTN
jgi:membrane-bound ClpP family serine protease